MKKVFYLIFIWFWGNTGFSQNLIVNGDFSQMNVGSPQDHGSPANPCTGGRTLDCGSCYNSDNRCCVLYWHSGNHGYFNYCTINNTLPHRTWTTPGLSYMPHPLKGDGYLNMFIGVCDLDSNYINPANNVPFHDLQYPLEKDTVYTLEFYGRVSRWQEQFGGVQALMAPGNIAVYFHNDEIEIPHPGAGNTIRANYPPTAEWYGTTFDTVSWRRIIMSFTATGNEKLMYIYRHNTDASDVVAVDGVTRLANVWIHLDAFALYKSTDTLFSISIGNDTLLCPGDELTLTADLDDGFKLDDTLTTYLWNTGDTVPQISVTSPGIYWVEVTINQRFKARDSIVVAYEEPLVWEFPFTATGEIERCYEVLPLLASGPDASHGAVYNWSTGESAQTIEAAYEGEFHLRVITECFDEEGSFYLKPINCNIDSSAIKGNVFIPSAFTPEGRNPLWIMGGLEANTHVEVFNRWGQRIFHSTDYRDNWWDGTHNGKPVPTGVYTYRIIAPREGKSPLDETGNVMIVR
ncbi:MAG: gliding motility-associated C-terminal domain-containing protein [Cryomorphaceae bacterium]|nr:gliding motility-associated C-terminal domain-containing protein [Cryomorphaceae bacterium]